MITALGRALSARIIEFGEFTRYCGTVLQAVMLGTATWGRWDRLSTQLYLVGSRSVPVLALTGAFIGAILAVEGWRQFEELGQEHRLGGVVTISMVRQIGPVLAGVMLAGRVGCALAAELGSMRVTEQLDAMRVMGSDPMRVLVAPRVLACILMIPALTAVSSVCGMLGSWVIITQYHGVEQRAYWDFIAYFITWFDVVSGQIKSVFFGGAIGLIACFKGLSCGPGAQGVGRATTESFVLSFVAIVVLSLVLAQALNTVDALLGF
ncbi:MAG: ABC transporter permease [Planctomycetota bacterium]